MFHISVMPTVALL